MKIILLDIETSPLLTYNWGTFQQNAIDVKEEWKLLSFAWKVLGLKEVFCETKEGQESDKALTKKLWKVMDEADVIIAHNGDAFDIKKANAKFLEHGLEPTASFQSVDTLKIARRRFKLTSNRLNGLAALLGVGQKTNTGGFSLWLGCMADKAESWKLMTKYNKQDVLLLEKVYLKLRPWDNRHPNVSVRGITSCPKCRSLRLVKRGLDATKAGVYQLYRCTDCGGRARETTVLKNFSKKKVVNG